MSEAKSGEFFDEVEGMSPAERAKYQSQKLREAVDRAYQNAPSVKEMFDRARISPSEIQTAKDLEKLPVTRKGDLIELQKSRPPYGGLVTIPTEEVERVFITPGPIYGPHHIEGVSWFGKTMYAAGFRKGDIVINTPTYHMSPAGMLFHEGIRASGATVVPTGIGNVEAQIKTMLDLKVTGYAGMPSFLMNLIKSAEEMGHEFRRDFRLKRAWFTGEMLPPSLRKTFEEDYGIATFQCYAATDLGGCVAYECREKSGMHFMDEYVIEIVDPQTGGQLPPDEVGEIVATPLHNNAWGLIRYGTGDMSMYLTEPCPCGRSSYRLGGIVGRAADAVKVRGMFVIAKQAEQVFSEFNQIFRYQLIVGRKEERDELVLTVELTDESIDKPELSQRLSERFAQLCRVRPDRIEFVRPGTITEDAQTIVDERRWR